MSIRNKLRALVKGDKVCCTGDSSFCQSSTQKIKKLTVKYDEDTGKPYNVIHLAGDRKFDSRTGYAINPPLAYYILPIK